jgi:hypothetical protein
LPVAALNCLFSDSVLRSQSLGIRTQQAHISELIIGGQTIVRDRRVLGVDLPAIRQEVLAQIRSGLTANGTLASALAALDQTIARHHLSNPPCC